MPLDSEGLRDLAQLHEDRKRMVRIEEALAQQRRERNGHGDSAGLTSLVKWLAIILASLVVAGIVGSIAVYREVGEMKGEMAETQRRLDRLESWVFPRR